MTIDEEANKWTNLGTIPYRNLKCYDMCWGADAVDLYECIVAVAQYGGLIALSRDPRKILQVNTEHSNTVFLYSASGVFVSKFEWRGTTIVHMGWTLSEQLVVVGMDGTVAVFNALGNKLRTTLINDGRDKVIDARVYSHGLVVLTKKLELWCLQDLEDELSAQQMPSTGLDRAPLAIEVVPPENSKDDRLEVYLSPASNDEDFGGTIIVVSWDAAEDQALSTPPITRIAVSPDGKWIAKFTSKGHIVVSPTSFHQPICDFDTHSLVSPAQLCWCGTDAVVAQWGPSESGQDTSLVLMVGPAGQYASFTYSGVAHLVTERDGLRIMTNTRHDFLQRVPQRVVEVCHPGSKEVAAQLREAWEDYEKKQATSMMKVQRLGADLPLAVEACIEAAGHEFDHSYQRSLLRAAAYGKCLCDFFDAQKFVDTCHILRVLNAVRDFQVGIPLTLAQYEHLGEEMLIERLIQRHLHYLAYEICQYRELKRVTEKVLVHWGCAKVQASQPDEVIRQAVVAKLSQVPGISYAEVANTAFRKGKLQLAISLLQHEPKAAEQVRLLLKMGEDIIALDKAIASGDTELVHLVVLNMKQKYDGQKFYRVMVEKPQASDLIIAYLQEQEPKFLEDYYVASGNLQLAAGMAIHNYFETKNLDMKERLLNKARHWMQQKGRKEDAKVLEEQVLLLKAQADLERETGKPEYLGLSVSETIYQALLDGQPKRAAKGHKDFSVPNKRFWWLKVKALAALQDWEGLEKFSKEKSPVGYKPFFDECMAHENTMQASKYIPRIADVAERVEAFCIVGKFQDAIDEAYRDKNPDLLDSILHQTSSQMYRSLIADYKAKLGY